ncbi:MAG TPA: inorganic diphosphatase [Candidatus Saccharimonas sp.]|nr:inorganic diphosphatase [Candidatus Saccharimonas sp.]
MPALPTWEQDGEIINTIIEIPKGSMNKIEWDTKLEMFVLDRVEPGIFAKPVNYGFIPGTIDEDGDPLDTLVVADEPIPMGVLVRGRVLGVLNFEDGGDIDHKIVVAPADDRHTGDALQSLEDLPAAWKKQIEFHFNHYKDLKKPGSTIVKGWGDAAEAKSVIGDCVQRAS